MTDRPVVLVACVRNAGRSQIAAALLRRYAGDHVEVRSGGSAPAQEVHREVTAVLAAQGLDDLTPPRAWTSDDVAAADVVVTMGCGDSCPYFPGTRYEDWDVEDPGDQDAEAVRRIVADIDDRVQRLLARLGVPVDGGGQARN